MQHSIASRASVWINQWDFFASIEVTELKNF